METIAKIIDAKKVWSDPDMVDFDIGERDYLNPVTPGATVVESEEATRPVSA